MNEAYPVFEKWTKILDWTLGATESYPRSVRFTLASRIGNISLDVLEGIISAIYTRKRSHLLSALNLDIEKLRVLFRISMQRRYISQSQYEYIIGELNEAGKMIGGWQKHEARGQSISEDR